MPLWRARRDLLQAKIATAPLIRADDSWDSRVERLIRQVLMRRTVSKPANGEIDVGFPHLLSFVVAVRNLFDPYQPAGREGHLLINQPTSPTCGQW